jgi:excisionase family DNA binding protein
MPETCTTREAAKKLNVALSTVQTWVESGHLEAWKTPGGHRRIPLSSIDKLLETGMAQRAVDQPRPFRILIVEDEDHLREIYKDTLATWSNISIELNLAANGYEGLVKAAESNPDLMITDLSMPDMDGFKMIKALRNGNETQHMPIVVVTGICESEVKAGEIPEDITILGKPIPFDKLRAIVDTLIEKKGRFERISLKNEATMR